MRRAGPARLLVSVSAVALAVGAGLTSSPAGAVTPSDVRATNDFGGGYTSVYTLATGTAYTDAVLTECGQARGRQNEPSVAVNPRNSNVVVGSSNDYCGVLSAGNDADGAPIPAGPIWLGYYRSTDGGTLWQSSLVPGYPGDSSPYGALAAIRTASAGDPVLAWDKHGRLFAGAESSDSREGNPKGFGDVWVATFDNPAGENGSTLRDGLRFVGSTIVAKGAAASNLQGKFHDKTSIEVDRTSSVCEANVYFAWSRFTSSGGSNIYFSRSTDHGASWSKPSLLTTSSNSVQGPDIAVTGDGRVTVTWGSDGGKGKGSNQPQDTVQYATSGDCGATFSPYRTAFTFPAYVASDQLTTGGSARDCGTLTSACTSGFDFFRSDTLPRSTADQADRSPYVYLALNGTKPGTVLPTGTTFNSAGEGAGGQSVAWVYRLNIDSGAVTGPVPVDPQPRGHQIWPDLSIGSDGVLHLIWWDSRNDPEYSVTRPIGNSASGKTGPSLDVFATTMSKALVPATGVQVSTATSNPNFNQFGGRTVPFAGDYLWIDSSGGRTVGVWTDWRNTAPGDDPRVPGPSKGSDVLQCRTLLPTGSYTGDTCPRAGGLDQNIYGSVMP